MRLALISPVLVPEPVDPAHAFHGTSLAHAQALAREGAEVHLLLPATKADLRVEGGVHLHRIRVPRSALLPLPLLPALRRIRPDVVHLFHFRHLPTVAALTQVHPRVFGEYNGGDAPRSEWKRRLLARAVGRSAGIFFTAQEQAAIFAGLTFPRIYESPEVSARALPEVSADEGRRRLHLKGDPLILAVARLEAPKDPWTILKTFAYVKAQRPGARLLWLDGAQRGRESGAIEAEIRALGLGEAIAIRAGLDATEMACAYAGADVMLQTSTREICGHAFMEGLSAGVPLVAGELPATKRWGPPVGMTLCPLGAAETFASALLTLHDRHLPRQPIRDWFQAQLSYPAIAAARLEIYRKAGGTTRTSPTP